jgi:hypothetical protein
LELHRLYPAGRAFDRLSSDTSPTADTSGILSGKRRGKRMEPAVRVRVERAILRALADGPLTGAELAARLQAVIGRLTDAPGWPLLLPSLREAGKVRRVGFGCATRWAVAGGR